MMNQDFDQDLESYHSESLPESGGSDGNRTGFKRVLLDILETLFISAALFLAINAVSARIRVDGFSMEPSMHSGEFVIVNKLAYRFGSPERGDVIVFRFPRDPQQEYIKRVIGLPGDEIAVSDGVMSVNGDVLDEPYILQSPAYSGSWQVPEGHLFVMGDNRNNSSDSHNWGPVALDFVIGKALVVYWPVSDWGLVEHYSVTPQ
jgi:signal peptidase I